MTQELSDEDVLKCLRSYESYTHGAPSQLVGPSLTRSAPAAMRWTGTRYSPVPSTHANDPYGPDGGGLVPNADAQSRSTHYWPTPSRFKLQYCIACNYWCGDTMICTCCSGKYGTYFADTHVAPEFFDDYIEWNTQASNYCCDCRMPTYSVTPTFTRR